MMLQCFPDIQYSKIFGEHSIRFQTSCRKPVANVRAFEVKSSVTLKALSLATVLVYLHDCMNLSAETCLVSQIRGISAGLFYISIVYLWVPGSIP